MTEPFFFSSKTGKDLFGILFRPAAGPARTGFVLCGGFAGEFGIFRSHFGHVGRTLAERGVAALRFDYHGYGDSAGSFTDASIESMCDDTERALDELRSRAGVERLGLIGVRLGGTVAALCAARRSDVESLVLWEPWVRPWDELYAELRQTLAMQTVLFRDVKITRDQIVENVMAGRPSMLEGYDLNIIDDGFPLSAELIRTAKETDLAERLPAPRARTLVVHVRKKEGPVAKPIATLVERLRARGARCDLEVAIEPSLPWKHDEFYTTHSPVVLDKTVRWLDSPESASFPADAP